MSTAWTTNPQSARFGDGGKQAECSLAFLVDVSAGKDVFLGISAMILVCAHDWRVGATKVRNLCALSIDDVLCREAMTLNEVSVVRPVVLVCIIQLIPPRHVLIEFVWRCWGISKGGMVWGGGDVSLGDEMIVSIKWFWDYGFGLTSLFFQMMFWVFDVLGFWWADGRWCHQRSWCDRRFVRWDTFLWDTFGWSSWTEKSEKKR